jgi:hypothetical protein
VAVAVVAPLQLAMSPVQEKLVVLVVEPLETVHLMPVRLSDQELRVKVLAVAHLPY